MSKKKKKKKKTENKRLFNCQCLWLGVISVFKWRMSRPPCPYTLVQICCMEGWFRCCFWGVKGREKTVFYNGLSQAYPSIAVNSMHTHTHPRTHTHTQTTEANVLLKHIHCDQYLFPWLGLAQLVLKLCFVPQAPLTDLLSNIPARGFIFISVFLSWTG